MLKQDGHGAWVPLICPSLPAPSHLPESSPAHPVHSHWASPLSEGMEVLNLHAVTDDDTPVPLNLNC